MEKVTCWACWFCTRGLRGTTRRQVAHSAPLHMSYLSGFLFLFSPVCLVVLSQSLQVTDVRSFYCLLLFFFLFLPKLIRIFCTFMSTRVHGCEHESWHLFRCLLLGLFDWRRKMPGTRSGIRFPCILPWHYPRTTWEWQIEEAHWHIVQGLCCMACTSALPGHTFSSFSTWLTVWLLSAAGLLAGKQNLQG